ncbi:MAG: alkaline phosphatase family protein [Syntrophobacteraceae bacterium]
MAETKLSRPPRLLIIGLDGAQLAVIEGLVQQGRLPHLGRLLSQGASGLLTSTLPPVTPSAWTSFMTGKNPGKHGLFDFLELVEGAYNFQYTNARSRLVPTMWDTLNSQGLRVGLFNIPMTFPPMPLEGFVVAGMDTPDADADFIHPRELKEELTRKFGRLELDIRHLGFLKNDTLRSQILDELKAMEVRRADLFLYLLEHHPVDVGMIVLSSTDTVQHYFWHYQDQSHHWNESVRGHRFESAVEEVYANVDAQVGRLLSSVPPETSVIVMSDHGGGGIGDVVLHINQFLLDEGFLSLKPIGAASRLYRRVLSLLDDRIRGWLNSDQKAKLAYLLPWLRTKWEGDNTGLSLLDWPRTKAFGIEVLGFPSSIWVNLKGRFPHGCVNPGSEYEALLREMKSRFLNLKVNGRQLIPHVYVRDEMFSGPFRDRGPDMILDWWDNSSFSPQPSFRGGVTGPAWEPTGSYRADYSQWTGTHRLEGTLVMAGPPFKNGVRLDHPHILDIAPTVFYLLGKPVPEDLDGRVLLDGFHGRFVAENPLNTEAAREMTLDRDAVTYTQAEADKIAARLKQLGYLD